MQALKQKKKNIQAALLLGIQVPRTQNVSCINRDPKLKKIHDPGTQNISCATTCIGK